MKLHKVMKITGLTSKTLYNIKKKAIDCGYDPKVNAEILASYVQDEPQSGQPGILLEKYNNIIVKVTWD